MLADSRADLEAADAAAEAADAAAEAAAAKLSPRRRASSSSRLALSPASSPEPTAEPLLRASSSQVRNDVCRIRISRLLTTQRRNERTVKPSRPRRRRGRKA